jgi:serine/threonine-protein kinase
MPYVDGESLRHRLAAGPLPLRDAVRVLRDVARALAVAHQRGVVHRDVKPDNILLADGAAMVADFGVAKAIASARECDGGAGPMTTAGFSLGTPQYMAPEQIAADPATDHRADLYAFGVTAYEVLTGEAPFAGRAPQAVVRAHFAETPPPPSSRRAGVPAALDRLVMRCLEKDPVNRPASADEVAAALEDPAVISGVSAVPSGAARALAGVRHAPARLGRRAVPVALAALLLLGGAFVAHRPVAARAAATNANAASVAVLPFVFSGDDSSRSPVALGVAEQISGALARLPGLHVASGAGAQALQRRIATGDTSAMPVRSLVEGVVEQEGDRLRLSLRLVVASDGFTVWADSFEGRTDDVFAMEDAAAAAMRDALREHFGLAADPRPAAIRPAAAPSSN